MRSGELSTIHVNHIKQHHLSPSGLLEQRENFFVFTKRSQGVFRIDLMDGRIYGVSDHEQMILPRSDIPGFLFRTGSLKSPCLQPLIDKQKTIFLPDQEQISYMKRIQVELLFYQY